MHALPIKPQPVVFAQNPLSVLGACISEYLTAQRRSLNGSHSICSCVIYKLHLPLSLLASSQTTSQCQSSPLQWFQPPWWFQVPFVFVFIAWGRNVSAKVNKFNLLESVGDAYIRTNKETKKTILGKTKGRKSATKSQPACKLLYHLFLFYFLFFSVNIDFYATHNFRWDIGRIAKTKTNLVAQANPTTTVE